MIPETSTRILEKVRGFINDCAMLKPNSKVYVGFSGGPDSAALLHILHSLGYECVALHCNFHLRGAESDRDQEFAERFCTSLGVPCEVKEFDTPAYMAETRTSLEMAARKLRYEWWAEKTDAPIALGHHLDDSIETMLMNMMRGTGIDGMTGIVPVNKSSNTVRPLLCVYRKDIMEYIEANSLSYVTDSTNLENDTLRNSIRNRLIPLMEELVPTCKSGMRATSEHLAEAASVVSRYAKEYDKTADIYDEWGLKWKELKMTDLNSSFGIGANAIANAWKKSEREKNMTVLYESNRYCAFPTEMMPIETYAPQIRVGWKVAGCRYFERFDADNVQSPITVRRWHPGDRIDPLGMNGKTKLVADILKDGKCSPMRKRTVWVVEDASGKIIWIIGHRISESCKITQNTKNVLGISAV